MNYAAVNTKARAVYAKYIKKSPQLELLGIDTPKAALAKLNELWNLEVELPSGKEAIDLYEINKQMEHRVYEELKDFLYFFQGEDRKFYDGLLERYRIRDIKRIFRTIVHGENRNLLKESLVALNPSIIPEDGDFKVEKFIETLKDTDYARKLMVYTDVPDDRILFYIEMTLDKSYYENLILRAKKLNGPSSKLALSLIGHHIDLLNITYLYRGKKTYSILPQEMINFLIDGGEKLSKQRLSILAYEDTKEFLKIVADTNFKFLFPGGREANNMDIRMERDLYTKFLTAYQNSGFDIGKILAITILMELQIRDISTVLEGKRLGIHPNIVRDLLTIPLKEGEVWQ